MTESYVPSGQNLSGVTGSDRLGDILQRGRVPCLDCGQPHHYRCVDEGRPEKHVSPMYSWEDPGRAARAGDIDVELIGPRRMRSANCIAGDHPECLGMVEQDDGGGITDCLCHCHWGSGDIDVERLARALCTVHHPPSGRSHDPATCGNLGQAAAIAEAYSRE